MAVYSQPTRRPLTVIAQDPGVRTEGRKILMTRVQVPAERLAAGPRGHRVHVVDFDTSANKFYRPAEVADGDPYLKMDDAVKLETDAHFHAQNVFAIVSSTLLTFERALGRHVSWGFMDGQYHPHQLKVAPHAFAEPNAYYSRQDEGLLFGYFPARDGKRTIFTCLSHDVVVHETTHAVLDGLRRQYMRPSSADQAAFHEGYADIIALLSVLRSPELVEHGLAAVPRSKNGTCLLGQVESAVVECSFLTGLAEQMGQEMEGLGRDALRRSIKLPPSPKYLHQLEFQEAHRRGEILVAVVMRAFLQVWWNRLRGKIGLEPTRDGRLSRSERMRRVELWRVVEEGAKSAEHLLQMLIRALDYMPPIDINFGDFLSAVITADSEACPGGVEYHYRETLLGCFKAFGITPSSSSAGMEGRWESPTAEFVYGDVHFEPMRWDREAVFRFIWENRRPLKLVEDAFTMVESVRPVVRVAPDGFTLREVVVEYLQLVTVRADELSGIGLKAPDGMPDWQKVDLHGGGTLVFDEFGHLKFDISNRLNSKRQNDRLEQLWRRGAFREAFETERRFARLHRDRALDTRTLAEEQW